MAELLVPKLNSNDTDYVLTDWLVGDGEPVGAGDPVAVVETSKATEELEAAESGTLHHLVAAGARCRPGRPIADVRDGAAPARTAEAPPAAAAQPAGGPLVTRPAQALADELGVTAQQIAALGLAVVRREDVEALRPAAAPAADAPAGVPLTRVQQGVARAVEISHRTIPAAYTVVRMDLGPARAHAVRLTRAVRRPVGLAELFVQQVAALHAGFPRFFAAIDGSTATLADAPHIGVTVDLGEGLYVPCVRDPRALTTAEIATRMMAYRIAATSGTFRESDLGGANFVITLHTDGDVVLAVPFVFPGTVCALAVTSPADGSPANIGLAYDHRLINGRDAALFLHALKNSMEGLA
ncbi:2-oxo acid dehydrogenase subunit E2 [Streptomyces cocklensis]|uniref:Dihydrolipoamide acetyltransferase component of pyruvate dehydrogenase complex n=1 Tax=Actinacidiphila cocklensis TaxID=887465 RepID=A0A9W4E8N6_9ACTN|nr:2-oxo acid dehydrogenase subunit E2 [Actinacidiphila cocklensis]MDD1063080.1 2-oxo acid dehydrogenase subunit E2 [Actinacidiphila cocklensis]WSX77152.1 2-oxo acid dehydrogenase subunit E2 [Streptomyces sp. NBC_00899]CAG6395516.1 Dihydrolipoamide acetyltransferase component of pyruvate dehydrogenase complex [Actinacidiphila cocklensis]